MMKLGEGWTSRGNMVQERNLRLLWVSGQRKKERGESEERGDKEEIRVKKESASEMGDRSVQGKGGDQ